MTNNDYSLKEKAFSFGKNNLSNNENKTDFEKYLSNANSTDTAIKLDDKRGRDYNKKYGPEQGESRLITFGLGNSDKNIGKFI